MAYDFNKLDKGISAATAYFEKEIGTLRAGRANPVLLEDIRVEAYGTAQPLKNVASISVLDAKTLQVSPWDKSILEQIQKGIEAANIGFNIAAQKDFIRVALPDLTEERRRSLLKILSERLEESRIIVRRERDEVWREIQANEKTKKISEDEKFRAKDQMEERVKKGIEKLEEIAKKKEKEIVE